MRYSPVCGALKRAILIVAAIINAAVPALWVAPPAYAASEAESVLGRWRFTVPLDSAEITALDDREAGALVGRIFTITKDRVAFGRRDCGAPTLDVMLVEPTLYLREQAHASSENLHLPNPVKVVDLGCTVAFIKSHNKLTIFWKGWFFDAVRVRR
ncbi:hypothetical protein ACFFTM_01690 [Pseudoduganella plicata]|uniref:DUF2147 domain-containing protein n=1 Tax=Pseudoduganella plicata TaxID=321984 RepID=A0A4V1ATS9_9BURK|nr:hypothetical protein [Pseudoduganella plicata]QBQ36728.1 hypothetical protein E1742_11540 [Pseudoduganella plicata]GGY73207.1 hypothetical protein GCM10007388_01600 [Pseudoduganella plicata]